MKDNKKKVIIIALLILVILVGIKILIGNNKNRKNVNNANTSNAAIDEKNVKTLSDGTRLITKNPTITRNKQKCKK